MTKDLVKTPTWANFKNEYKLHRLQREHGISCSDGNAVGLYEGHVVLLTERINTGLINQLLGAIEKFDGFLSQNKLSSVQGVLSKAEAQLNDVLTGKADEKTASAALANVTGLYNALATFFTQDLPTLMKTQLFRQARQMWEQSPTKETVPLSQLPVEHAKMKQMFSTALNQRSNSGAMGYLSRRFGVMQQLASGINPGQVADNLMNMSFAQLDALVGAAPKPAPAAMSQAVVKQAEEQAKTGGQPAKQGTATPGSPQNMEQILAASQNPAISDNAKEIVQTLVKAGFKAS